MGSETDWKKQMVTGSPMGSETDWKKQMVKVMGLVTGTPMDLVMDWEKRGSEKKRGSVMGEECIR